MFEKIVFIIEKIVSIVKIVFNIALRKSIVLRKKYQVF